MSDVRILAQPTDVVECYRFFLGREPENSDIIKFHLSDQPTVWELIRRFAGSTEYEAIKIDDGCSAIWQRQDGRGIRVEASPEAVANILGHVERIWSDYGAEDPYYSVLTDPSYRAEYITDYLSEEFYETGYDAVANFKHLFERNRIVIDPGWHILELGCGVGRVGEHFCRLFEFYEGVDISQTHIELAQKRFAALNINNARFHLLTNAMESSINFDLFYSLIVLQHNPPQ